MDFPEASGRHRWASKLSVWTDPKVVQEILGVGCSLQGDPQRLCFQDCNRFGVRLKLLQSYFTRREVLGRGYIDVT